MVEHKREQEIYDLISLHLVHLEEEARARKLAYWQVVAAALNGTTFPPGSSPSQTTENARFVYDKIQTLLSDGVKMFRLSVAYEAALDGRPYPATKTSRVIKPITEADLVGAKPSPRKIIFTPTPKRLGKPGEPDAFSPRITHKLLK